MITHVINEVAVKVLYDSSDIRAKTIIIDTHTFEQYSILLTEIRLKKLIGKGTR